MFITLFVNWKRSRRRTLRKALHLLILVSLLSGLLPPPLFLGLLPTSLAEAVEDLLPAVPTAFAQGSDYGDLPDTTAGNGTQDYDTLAANGGPSHGLAAILKLGAQIDSEADGQPNLAATGDDTTGTPDDEDSLQIKIPLRPGGTSIVAIGLQQPLNSTSYLNFWIDFNQDGDFDDTDEQIATDNTVTNGNVRTDASSANLVFPVPANASTGLTYARVRLCSTAGNCNTPGGAATDGEVEDYQVEIPGVAQVGNYVWLDTNGDGIQQGGETGVEGVVVQLYRAGDNTLMEITTTDATGQYTFTGVLADTYYIDFVPASGYSFTLQGQGGDPTLDSDADQVTGQTGNFTVAGGDSDPTLDAGLVGAVDEQVFCQAIPWGITEVNHTFTLPKFNLALGVLNSVTINGYGGLRQWIGIENSAANAQVARIQTSSNGALTLPDSTSLGVAVGLDTGLLSYAAYDGIVDLTGSSAYSYDDWQYGLNAQNFTYTPVADFIALVPNETIDVPFATLSSITTTGGGGNLSEVQRTYAFAGVCVNYQYTALTPATPTAVLTITKTISGTGSGPFDITIEGPNSYNTTAQINGGEVLTVSVPTQGIYTVTESTPAGWTTVYTATPGTGGSTNAVVTIANANTATLASLPITGTVFRDFNSDGAITTNGVITDTGMPGVTVTAYDKNGNNVGSAVTADNGSYTLNPSGNGPYRIEFSDLPDGYEPTSAGADNGTSTQFVTTAGDATNVNLGINQPCDYCQANPSMITSRLQNGTSNHASNNNQPSAYRYPYSISGHLPNPVIDTATHVQDTGSIWGLAYNRESGILYHSTLLRRHAGLGPNGIGAIYQQTNINNPTSVSLFYDFGALAGTVPTNTIRFPGTGTAFGQEGPCRLCDNIDAAVFNDVGKVGLGDVTMSPDNSTLYASNLFDRNIYAINTSGTPTAQVIGSAPWLATNFCGTNPNSTPTGVARPWALKAQGDSLYAGVMCDASTSTTCTATGACADLRAYVYEWDGVSWSSVLPSPIVMDYTRNLYKANGGGNFWHPWVSDYATMKPYIDLGESGNASDANYPQPILTQIEVDVDGSLLLAFGDRTAYQLGYSAPAPDAGSPGDIDNDYAAAGDLLRVTHNSGTYTLENNGVAGSLVGTGINGPGGNAFYDLQWLTGSGAAGRADSVIGGLALLPGSQQIALVAGDPWTSFSGGLSFYSNLNGSFARAATLYQNTVGSREFAKSGGLGDMVLLCDEAPLEIGNRVWDDLNGNGIQDPGEPGLNGLLVSLEGPTGTVSATTDPTGLYYFSNLQPNSAYTLTMSVPAGYELTTLNAAALSGASVSSNHAISDTRDSDAMLVGGLATIYYTTGSAGQNNHGLDFGFTQPVNAQVDILNIAPIPVPDPGGFTVTKVVTTTDGSSPAVSGNFAIVVNCAGVAGYPSTQLLTAGETIAVGNLVTGTVCTLSEDTLNLPAAPAGYTWVNAQIAPSSVTIASNLTATVTAVNTLAPLPVVPTAVLTITKTISGTGSGPFDITIEGPNSYNTTAQINGGEVLTVSVPTQGVYTVTESTPLGWTTVYTATPGTGGSTNAVVTIANANTATLASLPISGMVFRDFNSDGEITDTGMPSVTVTAYDKAGNNVGSAVTDANGTYTLNPTGDGPYRIEFSDLPAGYEPTSAGADNGTSTQFVITAGDATNVNLGVAEPSVCCTANQRLVTTIFQNGIATGQTNPSLVAAPTTVNGVPTSFGGTQPDPATQATIEETGAVWGLAYQPTRRYLFTAAMLKRHAGLGTAGLGGVYVFDMTSDPAAAVGSFDLQGVSPTNGGPAIDLGSITRSGGSDYELPNSPSSANIDLDAFAKVGAVGFGGIDLSDANTLWLVNLNQRALIRLAVGGAVGAMASSAVQYPLAALTGFPSCTSGTFRPWALTFHGGQGYLGGVCDGAAGTTANLTAHLLSFDPDNVTAGLTTVVTFPLTYNRETVSANSFASTQQPGAWNTWISTWGEDGSGADNSHPQPILSDLEFTENGSIVLGFSDRWGHQTGTANYTAVSGSSTLFTGFSGGDIVHVCHVGGSYFLEGTAQCPDHDSGLVPADMAGGGDGSYGRSGTDGLSNTGEFYPFDYYDGLNATVNAQSNHLEVATGGLMLVPGSQQVVTTVFDPYISYSNGNVGIYTQGLHWYSTQNGSRPRVYMLQNNDGVGTATPGGFGKASGLGDLELIGDPAPIEIGNRVWDDLNGNGVQDPGEPGLSGLQVSLQGPTSTVNTTTDSNGLYYFSNLQPNSAYTLTMNGAAGYELTTPNAAALSGASVSSNHAISDTRDSDAVLVGGLATIYYTTGSAGQNNHGLDFGFTQPASGLAEILNIAPPPVPGGFSISKAITTTDGSTPSVSGTFDVVVSCLGAAGYPTTLTLDANGTPLSAGGLVTGTRCSFVEDTVTLPAAPAGYTWINAQISPASIIIQDNVTATVTATNWLAPLPEPTTQVLTVTKTISGTGSGPFALTITGPSGYITNTTINGGDSRVLTGLVGGIYTVTETTPTGWTTTYTIASGTGTANASNALVTLGNVNTAPLTAPGLIGGSVFRDFDSDGVDDGANEIGAAGILVTAYDRDGISRGTGTTNASGAYSMTTTGNGPYRVEFSNLPSGYEPSTHGAGNGTSTQFVSAPATTVSLGINYPADYCQNNPNLCTPVYTNGNPTLDPTLPSMLRYPYTSASTTSPAPTQVADRNETGATWGLAYNRSTDILYTSAFLRRHVGLGPNGLGAIYQIPMADGVAGTPTLFFDVTTVPGVDVGTIGNNTARGLGATGSPSADAAAFDGIGKLGLGDIDISDDGSTLYTVNLNERTLLRIPTLSPSAANVEEYAIPQAACTGGEARPFATKYYHEQVYVGLICDGTTSGLRSDMQAIVYEFDPVAETFTSVFAMPLDFQRGIPTTGCVDSGTSTRRWNPWTADYTDGVLCLDGYSFPQPMLSDVEFDVDGSMILGFADRWGYQMGRLNNWPNGTGINNGISSGDILRVYNNNGVFVLESNGSVGPRTSAAGVANGQGPGNGEFYAADTAVGLHAETAQGGLALRPGSGEVVSTGMDTPEVAYTGGVRYFSNTNGSNSHSYQLYSLTLNGGFGKANGLGDLELLCDEAPIEIGNRVWNDLNNNGIQDPGEPGINGVPVSLQGPTTTVTITTSVDGNYYFGNLRANTDYVLRVNPASAALRGLTLTQANMSALSGASVSSNHAISDTRDSDAVLVSGASTIYYTTGRAGQNNHGLDFGFTQPVNAQVGILNIAPTSAQFGDRVWVESDNDGLASTGVITPVAGLVITATNGTLVYTATTNAQGYYSFTVPADTYTVTYGTVPPSYGAVVPSATPGGSSESGNSGGYGEAGNPDTGHTNNTTVTLTAGQANWQLDFAFWLPAPTIEVIKYTNGDDADTPPGPTVAVGSVVTWTYDITNTGNVTLTGITLVDDQEGGITCPVSSLAPGVGTTCILTGTATAGLYANTAIVTGTPTIGPVTPVTDTNPSHYTGLTAGLGDRVWYDTNHNGLQEPGDVGVAGVTVNLLDSGGTVISTTTTSATGYYSFTNLAPGVYSIEFDASTLPAGYLFTLRDQGGDDSADSDADPTTGRTIQTTLVGNEYDPTWDAGIWLPQPTIEVIKYTNGDDADTPPGPIVAVGSVVTWTYDITNTGNVTLTDITLVDDQEGGITCPVSSLAPGVGTTCILTGTATAGLYANTAIVTGTPTIGPVTPVTDTNPSHYSTPAQFGDRVWVESDNDGLASTGVITPVAGLVITATNGTLVYTATTNAQGYYSFTVPADTYTVTYGTVPPSYGAVVPSATPGGSSESGNSGSYGEAGNPDTGHTNNTTVTLTAGQANWQLDFAFWLPQPTIEVIKYTNGDDADTPPGPTVAIGSVVTWTYDITNTGNVTLTGITLVDDQEGGITCPVSSLAPGVGTTCILTGTATAGLYANTAIVTGTPTVGPVTPVTDTNPSHYTGLTAGLGDRVWYDTNHNGLQEPGDLGVTGVTVNLLDSGGTVISTTTTSATGYYSFTNLAPGVYSIEFDASTLPAGYLFTLRDQGGDDSADSDADPTTGRTIQTTLVGNEYDPTWDAGIWLPAPTIEVIKYTNGDDADTPPGPIVAVGSVVTWTYDITNTGNVTLTGITLVDDQEGGITCPVSSLAPGVGTTCILTGTATAGLYANTAIVTGTPTIGPVTPVTDTNPSHYSTPAQFGDRVWVESDNDGLASTGVITPVAGLVITATNGTAVYTTTTNAQGYYSFTVPADTYTVTYGTVPPSYGAVVPSATPGGSSESGNSGSYGEAGNPDTGHTNNTTVTLAAGQANWQLDFAFWLPQPTIEVIKYTNGDDADTPPGPTVAVGSVVTWTYDITNTGNVTLTGITLVDDQEGGITCPVSSLAPGVGTTCILTGTATAGLYANTAIVTGTPTLGPVTPVTDTNPSHYTGLTAGLGDRVWYDTNHNGLQEPGDVGVAGVTVNLLDSGGAVISTTTTSATGYYSFTNLAPGVYSIEFDASTLPAGYLFTLRDQGGDDSADSDANPTTGRTIQTTLIGNEYDPTWDAGIWLPQPTIAVIKYTNGYDADLAAGPTLAVGSVVTWTYAITNTGNVTLTNVTLVDDQEGTVTCPQIQLAPGGTMTCILTGTATAGLYANTAIVTGTPTLGPVTPVTDTNPSHYFGPEPSIALRKYTNGYDADTITGPYLAAGAPVTWTYIVTNTGNVTLTNLTLVDDQEGVIICPVNTLSVGGVTTCVATGSANVIGQYTNTAVITGTPVLPPVTPPDLPQFPPAVPPTTPVTDTNPSHYFVPEPSIALRKYTNGYDADTITGPYLAAGAPVTWTYIVTNTGNVTLTNLTLVDDQEGVIICPVNTLSVGGVTTCVATGSANVIGQYTNTAVITGTPALPPVTPPDLPQFPPAVPPTTPVTDTNPSHYFVPEPSIALRKYTNGFDADLPPGPSIVVGSPVTWTYNVTNTGNVTLTNLTLVDDQVGTITCPVSMLPAGGVTTCIVTGIADVIGQYANTAVITGTPALPPVTPPDLPQFPPAVPPTTPVTDTNPSHYNGVVFDLALRKVVAASTILPLQPGDDITFTVVISNQGTIDAYAIEVSDYLPSGLSLSVADTNGWSGSGSVVTNTVAFLAAGAETTLDVVLTIATNFTGTTLSNVAEISKADDDTNPNNTPPTDIDSTPDNDPTNDGTPKDNVTNEDHKNNPPDDEDDHDPATVPVQPILGAIGNYVWVDENSDGYQDAGEPGIPNVRVVLYDALGNQVAETRTDSSGHYLFPNLPLGNYFVDVDESTIPTGMTQTPPSTLPGADFGNQDHSGQGYPVTITPAAPTNLTADFGYNYNPQPPVDGGTGLAALGDRVWIDSDGDGAQDPGEIGVSGVVLTLYSDPDGNGIYDTVVATDTTDANGYYLFDELPPGGYVVRVTDSSNASHDILNGATYDQTGDPDHFGQPESTATPGTANDNQSTVPVVLAPGDVFLNVDFGYQPAPTTPLGSIGDTVWFDADADGNGPALPPVDGGAPVNQGAGGAADASEYGIPGVTVALIRDVNGDGIWQPATEPIIATTVTNANGQYLFSDLPLDDGDGDADYLVWVNDTNHVLAGLRPTYDYDDGLVAPDNFSARALTALDPDPRDQDFGYTPQAQTPLLGAIGDTVWFDVDNSGGDQSTQGNEPGIAGVVMELLNSSGTVIATATTDSNGHYYFGGLPLNATYQVQVAAENFLPGGVLQGLTNTYDPDSPFDGVGPQVTLTPANPVNLAQDFSYVYVPPTPGEPIGRIGNLVWLDPNANGIYEPGLGETPIGGVTVDLYRDLNGNGVVDPGEPRMATTVTSGSIDAGQFGSDGNYIFTGLPAGDYVVDVSDQAGVLNGYWHSLGITGQNNNSQVDPYAVTIGGSEPWENLTADFGYYVEPAAVGNYVWLDVNRDGIQNDGETGINGVRVVMTITYPNGVVTTLTTVTANDPVSGAPGWYSFGNLLLDEDNNGDGSGSEPTFVIGVDVTQPALATYQPTLIDQGANDTLDSDNPAGVVAQPIQGQTDTLRSNDANPIASYDFGFWRPASLGDLVWEDQNHNGTQDPGEPGIPGVTVTLTDGSGITTTTTTNANGVYTFTNLIPGVPYTVTFGTPSGYTPTTPNVGNDATDSDGSQVVVVLQPGEHNPTIDSGFWQPLALGNLVWYDRNNNGQVDAGEPGIANVTVQLFPEGADPTTATPLSTQVTDSNGNYLFADLLPGRYFVYIPTPPVQYPNSSVPTDLADNGEDNDDNGIQNIPGAPVRSPIIELVAETEPINDGDGSNGDLTIDFGFYQVVDLGNLVWHDRNNNGQVDAGENGIANVTVQLFPEGADPTTATPLSTQVTDSNGNYLFANLLPGRYFVYIPTPPFLYPVSTVPTDTDDNGEDNDDNGVQTGIGAPVRSPVIDLALGAEPTNDGDDANGDLTVDFGFFDYASLGDRVWFDTDKDGIQDPGETGVAGVTVTLYDGLTNLPLATTTTDANGNYRFDNLLPGDYFVGFAPPPGYSVSPINQGSNDAFDSDADPNNSLHTPVTNLESGEYDPTLDLGLYLDGPPASIGDRVWFDTNKDGIQDPGETGVPGVQVELHRADGTLVATITTDANGNYLFDNLVPGDYYLVFIPPAGYTISPVDAGGNDELDSDVDPNTGRTPVTTLDAGENDLTWDLGLNLPTEPARIGDTVWFDNNVNGIQDPGETGVPGVQVTLYTANGTPIATTVTNADGHYEFINLVPGDYYLGFTPPNGYISTAPNVGGDDAIDSDVNPYSGLTTVTTLEPGENDPTWDYGVYLIDVQNEFLIPPAGIGNQVWYDTNQNGVIDNGEVGVPTIIVNLYDANNVLISTDVTDANGNYLFPNLPPGGYYLEFVVADDYIFTLVGTDPSIDNDSNADPTTGTTEPTVLGPGEIDLNWDTGIYLPPTNLEDGDEPHFNLPYRMFMPTIAK